MYSSVKVIVVSSTLHKSTHPDAAPAPPPSRRARAWAIVAAVESAGATVAVLLDLLIPSLVMLAMAAVSLAVRREGLGSLGLKRVQGPARLALKMLIVAAVWSLIQLSVTMPVAKHVSGDNQDLSGFDDLEGNLGMLAIMLIFAWTLGAFAEELAYRGYLQTRLVQTFGSGRIAVVIAVLISSVLFGVAHSEQGAIGVLIVTLDGLVFSAVRYRYRSVWASVLAHGFNNTLGFIAFFLVGPIYGFW